jgi:hypothetical protein
VPAKRARAQRGSGIPAQANLREAQVKARRAGHSHNPAILEQLSQNN